MGAYEATASEEIHNPVSGETIVIRESAAQTQGRSLAWELRLAPKGKVPSGHTHPEQEERFTVREGWMRFRIAGRIRTVGPGETVTIPPGTAHHFSNAGRTEARVDVETRPALRMEELLRTAAKLAQGQRGTRRAMLRPVDLMLFMREFRSEVRAPYLPARLVRLIVGLAARLAETAGADRRYRRLRAR